MSVAEIKQELTRLSDSERFDLNAIWEAIESETEIESPAWHAEVLAEREQEIASAQASSRVFQWEEAKSEILRHAPWRIEVDQCGGAREDIIAGNPIL